MAECVAKILKLVKIRTDVSQEEQEEIRATIANFTDVFALSISEVKHIPGTEHCLDIPNRTVFNKKIHQWPLSPQQVVYFSKALDIMLGAGICTPIAAKDVKCVSPITLSIKTHTSAGMTIEELHQHINNECDSIGVTPPLVALDGMKQQPIVPQRTTETLPQKWHVCTNYMELNKVTQVLPMPQGDIQVKQQALCGHCWILMFNFAAGFYTVEIAEESQPYMAFYVKGRGYFIYRHMPFGLTGVPSCFNEVTVKALQGLVGTMIQLFVDNGAMASDIFPNKLADL